MSWIYKDWNQVAFPQVDYYADLPAVAPSIGLVYIVRFNSGVWPVNFHASGWYRSDGVNWLKFDDIQEILNGVTLTDITGCLTGVGGAIVPLGYTPVAANVAIVAATKTKITYDTKGLVTAGADATTADIADSVNKRYVTDANLVVIGNTSNTNTGDETQATIKTKLGPADTTVDGYLLTADWDTFNNKQAALTFGIADTNSLRVDDATAADNEFAKFTATGLEGRSYAEVKTDLSLNNVTNDAQVTLAGAATGQTIADGCLCIAQDTATFNNGTTTIDWRTSSNQSLTMTDNIGTIIAFTNPPAACHCTLKVIQDATGGRTINAWDADVKWPLDVIPTHVTTLSTYTIYCFYFDGSKYSGAMQTGVYTV